MTRYELILNFIKNPNYVIQRDGHIFRVKKDGTRVEIGYTTNQGYKHISILDNVGEHRKLSVHRIVWAKYGDSKLNKNLVLNHKDGDKTNNCIDNLEQVTQKENNLHRFRVLHVQPVIGNSKITKEQAEEIRSLRKNGWKYTDLMRKFNVGKTTISYVCNNKIWK